MKLLVLVVLLILGAALAWALLRARQEKNTLAPNAVANLVRVEKAARRLTLLRDTTVLKIYRVALGKAPLGAKSQEGDQRTPEGWYVIDRRKADSDFHRALHISYPNPDEMAQAARRGVEPGGDIMIHGLPNGRGAIGPLHRLRDWTAGCIAVTDPEIEEIWRTVPDGTPIEIRP